MGGSSARSTLILLVAEYVRPAGGRVPARRLLDGLGALGVSEPAGRQAVRRLARDGWLRRVPGPAAAWELGDPARAFLEEGHERFARAARATPAWDGRWLLLRTSVPESRRALRHQLRAALSFQGFGSLGQGWWVSPHTDAEGTARHVLERLGVELATSFVARSGAIGADPAVLVAEAWALDEARARYEKLLAEFERARPRGDADAFVAYTRLVDAYRWALAADPQLPAALVPPGWPGSAARRLLDHGYADWRPRAVAWWEAR